MNGPDPLRVEHLLAAGHHVLQEIDGDVVIRREVDAGVGGEEVEDLPLRAVLRLELLGGDLGGLIGRRISTYDLHVHVAHRIRFCQR